MRPEASRCPVALSEAELAFLLDVLSWLCTEHVIGSIALRNALLALRRYDPMAGSNVSHFAKS